MKKRVLFVDDDQGVLDGLERMLYAMSDEWEMMFCQSGRQALELMKEKPFDAIVSDMRMPEMNGEELLREIMRDYPETIRFILTGHASDTSAMRSADVAHQFLDKPCDPDELQALLRHTLSLRKMLNHTGMMKLVTSLGALPALPAIYKDLVYELNSPDPSIKAAADIVSNDVAMSAKILQLVNSSFFGLRNEVMELTQAATLIGLDMLKSLVLVADIFTGDSGNPLPKSFSQSDLSDHSMLVGVCARSIVESEMQNTAMIQEAFTAGLVHDVGKLILAVNRPIEYEQVCVDVLEGKGPASERELQVFGATHCEVGGYLLGLWGLPETIVDAVTHHHAPGLHESQSFTALTAVHAADALIREIERPVNTATLTELDTHYIKTLRLDDHVGRWREICQEHALEVHYA